MTRGTSHALLDAGANARVRDEEGCLPVDLARSGSGFEDPSVIERLSAAAHA